VVDVPQRIRFREEIREAIEDNAAPGGLSQITRVQVEEIGASLGMTENVACREFLNLRGRLWDVSTGSLAFSTVRSDEDPVDPDRNWNGFTDVILRKP
jgi:hypothetical protein